jgi:multidrug efflux pump subunit AcrB
MARNDPHTQLSDAQKDVLEELYKVAGVSSVDQLPYTDAVQRITNDFNRASGLSLSEADIWKALKNLGKQGRLGKRASSATGGNEDSEALGGDPPAASGP